MEMDRFAILGAEALNVPQPEEALPAVAEVILSTLGVARTEIYRREPTGGVVLLGEAGVAERVREDPPLLEGRPLAEWVAQSGQTIVEPGPSIAVISVAEKNHDLPEAGGGHLFIGEINRASRSWCTQCIRGVSVDEPDGTRVRSTER